MEDQYDDVMEEEDNDAMENDTENTSNAEVATGKTTKRKHASFRIIFDEDAASLGFTEPFALLLEPTEEFDKGNLFEAIVKAWQDPRIQGNKEYDQLFRKFVERAFNMSDSIFHNKEELKKAAESVTTNCDLLFNTQPSCSSAEETVQSIRVGSEENFNQDINQMEVIDG